MTDGAGVSVFGAIEQKVQRYQPGQAGGQGGRRG
jgi:hypothetical protein